MDGDFALGDDALFVAVNEFDGFFDGDDVAAEVGIDVVEEGGEGGGLAGAGGAGDEDEAGAEVAEFLDDGGDAQLVEGHDFSGDDPEDGAVAELLAEEVATEAVVGVHFVSEVEVTFLNVAFPGAGFADFAHHGFHVLMGEDDI